jgi:hypothetical protein
MLELCEHAIRLVLGCEENREYVGDEQVVFAEGSRLDDYRKERPDA